jgi:hypothetical protein
MVMVAKKTNLSFIHPAFFGAHKSPGLSNPGAFVQQQLFVDHYFYKQLPLIIAFTK